MAYTRRSFMRRSGQIGAAWALSGAAVSRAAEGAKSIRERVRDGEPLADTEVIDAHAHFSGLWHGDGPPQGLKDLIQEMDKCGINMALVSHGQAIGATTGEELKAAHDTTAKAVLAYPERLRGYVVFQPNLLEASQREMQRLLDRKSPFVGFKLHGVSHNYPLDGPNYRRVYQFAHQHKLPVLFHLMSSHGALVPILSGDPITPAVDRILAEFPEMRLIWAHFGRGVEDWAAFTAKHPNVTLETAASDTSYRQLERTVSSAGPDRILFGTDMTYLSAGTQLAKIGFADISEQDKRKILAGNVRRVFGASLSDSQLKG